MARQVHELNYSTTELDTLLSKADNNPFVIWHDESAGVYRFFPDETKRDIWINAYTIGEMSEEIAAYEFAPPITAPAPYVININDITDNQYILEGSKGTILGFIFNTVDGKGSEVRESVDVYYTFRSSSGTKTASAVYNPGTQVQFNIDEYISLGINNITILVRGRSTGATKTVVAIYRVIKLTLSSTFNIATPIEKNTDFEVGYTIEGESNKTVEFYIDGVLSYSAEISSLETQASKVQKILNYDGRLEPGLHTLQMKAKIMANNTQFYSNLLYYEFEIRGIQDTRTLISEIFPSTQNPFVGELPGLQGEQYVIKKLNWAYYSSNAQLQSATVQWRLYTQGGTETTLATRTADVVDAEIGTPPEPLSFMPTEYGSYHLQALILDPTTGLPMKDENDEIIIFGDYTISVVQNTNGIIEATEGLTMKLSGLGRDNSEPDTTKTSWIDRGHACTFHNMPFNNIAGYIDNAVVFNNGAYGIIDNKPLSSEINPTLNYGAVIEIDFETFDVDNDDTPLVQIGSPDSYPHFLITSTKAELVTESEAKVVAQFKSDERVKLCFIIYPKENNEYKQKIAIINNGVISGVVNYALSDTFIIGNSSSGDNGKIIVGDENGNAGIKIYYIRTYSQAITMYDEINNFFIDSGEDLAKLVAKNDIYAVGTKILDIDKLETTITTIKVTGNLNSIIGTGGKGKVDCKLEINSPFDSNINLHCDHAEFGNAGQSTLDKPIPSFHVKLDKNGNICYDRDNNMLPKNRWAFRAGNVPEKKFRLQANFMDSSNVHNGAFFRMINDVFPNVKVTVDEQEKYVLRIPAEEYAINNYSNDMYAIHGADPHGNNWKFPYTMHMVPDSIPCIVVYRKTEDDPYVFLGQYVIMEEKKANYANGMHSIYDGLDKDKNPDPFGFKSSKSEERLWDNSNCHQYELLTSTDVETLFLDSSQFDSHKVNTFELIYPDEDDLTPDEIASEWNKFKTEFVDLLCDYVTIHNTLPPSYEITEESQEAFNDFYINGKTINNHIVKFDRWHFAAYYILVLRNCCSDSTARNMEITTYDGITWLPKWWDVDMQCGLSQTNRLDLLPGTDRESKIPGTNVYAISGRINDASGYRSSSLWDLLENCTQFQEDVKTMEKALYDAGWTYANITKIQDEEFVDAWSQSLYNESSITKYINTNDLVSLQGDRTSHRHWFLKTSYDIWDGKHASGTYEKNIVSARTLAPIGSTFKVTPGRDTYLGWGTSISSDVTGVEVSKGTEYQFIITRALQYNNPLHIFSASNLESIDLSGLATTIAAELRVHNTYDEVTGTLLKTLIIGTPSVEEDPDHEGRYPIEFNTNPSFSGFDSGSDVLTRLETLSIQGLTGWTTVPMNVMNSIKRFYAAGSSLTVFNPANSTQFEELELPTTITAITMNNCNLTDENDNCIIRWFDRESQAEGYFLLEEEPDNWELDYKSYYIKTEDDEYIHISGDTAPEWEEGTYYEYKVSTPTAIQETTVSTKLKYIYFEGMGYDLGAKELIMDWINTHYDAETDFSTLSLYCKNVHWENVDINDLKLISQIPTVRASAPDDMGIRRPGNLTGYIKISGTITSDDIVYLKEAFGDDVFSATPGSLAIDANAGFVIGAPESILEGETITITGAIFPTSQAAKTVYYRLGLPQDEDISWISPILIEGKICYVASNVVLEQDSGKLITTETNTPTHTIVVEGYTVGLAPVSGQVEIDIVQRTYPSEEDSELDFEYSKITQAGIAKVNYLEASDEWSVVLSGGLGINASIIPDLSPETINGTLSDDNDYWDIDDSISDYFNIINTTKDTFNAQIPICPEDSVRGSITHTRNYVSGIEFSKSINFVLKAPKLAISAQRNAPLQAKLYNKGIAESENYTYDTELWAVIDITEYLPTNLVHLGELNAFSNITELDVNGFSLLGSVSTTTLEDNIVHQVDILPAKDIQLTLDLTSVDLRNTQVKGINLKQNSSLNEIYYSDYTTEVSLINQDNLEELDLTMVDDDCDITIDGCDNLETLNI